MPLQSLPFHFPSTPNNADHVWNFSPRLLGLWFLFSLDLDLFLKAVIKPIPESGPTKWRQPPWPCPQHESTPKPACTKGNTCQGNLTRSSHSPPTPLYFSQLTLLQKTGPAGLSRKSVASQHIRPCFRFPAAPQTPQEQRSTLSTIHGLFSLE